MKFKESREGLEYLMRCNDPWLRACAAYYIGDSATDEMSDLLREACNDFDSLVRETAEHAIKNLAG